VPSRLEGPRRRDRVDPRSRTSSPILLKGRLVSGIPVTEPRIPLLASLPLPGRQRGLATAPRTWPPSRLVATRHPVEPGRPRRPCSAADAGGLGLGVFRVWRATARIGGRGACAPVRPPAKLRSRAWGGVTSRHFARLWTVRIRSSGASARLAACPRPPSPTGQPLRSAPPSRGHLTPHSWGVTALSYLVAGAGVGRCVCCSGDCAVLALAYRRPGGQAVWRWGRDRAAARGIAFGAEAAAAARANLPAGLEPVCRRADDDGDVRVSGRVPAVLPACGSARVGESTSAPGRMTGSRGRNRSRCSGAPLVAVIALVALTVTAATQPGERVKQRGGAKYAAGRAGPTGGGARALGKSGR